MLVLSEFLELSLQTVGPLLGLLARASLVLLLFAFLPGLLLGLQTFHSLLLNPLR